MQINFYWIALGVVAILASILAVLIAKGYGILQVRWLNISRLRNLQQRASTTTDPMERLSLNAITKRCEALRGRWVLGEPDLAVITNTRSLVQDIAGFRISPGFIILSRPNPLPRPESKKF
jgi:hypothetical protein